MAVYFLDENQTLIKSVPFDKCIDVNQEMEIKGDSSLLNDVMTVSIPNDERLAEASYMAVREHSELNQSFDAYEIKKVDTDRHTTFTGVSLGASEMGGYVIEDIRPVEREFGYIANQLLSGTDWEVRHVDLDMGKVSTNFYYLSLKDALKKLQSFGCEIRFKVEISGNKISAKWIDIYKKMGNRTGKRFVYGKSALKVAREVSRVEVFTALIGRGKGEEITDESGESTGGYGRKINFANVEWAKSKGDPVDKPLGQKYVEIPQATEKYGITTYSGKKARIGIIDFNDEEDEVQLLRSTFNKLTEISRPQVEFKAIVANVGDFGIGDTVTIHRHDLGIHYEARLFKLNRNRKNNLLTEVSIGDKVVLSSTEKQANINSAIQGIEEVQTNLRNDVEISIINNRGTRTTFSNNEPKTKKVGDEWYRDHPSKAGERQMLVWNGQVWEVGFDSSDGKDASNLEYGVISLGGDLRLIGLTADSIVGGTLDIGRGLTIGNGSNPVLKVGADGKVVLNADEISIGLQKVATKEDLDAIELLPGEPGKQGEPGKDGLPGKDGAKGDKGEKGDPTYTWVVYGDDENGSGITLNPDGKRYRGELPNQKTETPVLTPSLYKWSPLFNSDLEEEVLKIITIHDTRTQNFAPSHYLQNYKDMTVREQKTNTAIGVDSQDTIGITETTTVDGQVIQTFNAGKEIFIRSADVATDSWNEWEDVDTASKVDDKMADLESRASEYADGVSSTAKEDAIRHSDRVTKAIQEILDQAVDDIVVNEGRIRATNEMMDIQFSKTGGGNRIRNSVGYSDLEFWRGSGQVGTIQNRELETVGAGSGFVFSQNSYIEQEISVASGEWTVSLRVNKQSSGSGYLEITHDGKAELVSINAGTEYNYDIVHLPFELIGHEVKVKIGTSVGSEMTVTSIMMNEGVLPHLWSFAKDEMYGSGFRFNENGLRVYQVEGTQYTQMTPEEFAGYALIGGEWQRVFALNGDTTEVAKLLAREEMGMGRLAMVNIETEKNSGWAFVRR